MPPNDSDSPGQNQPPRRTRTKPLRPPRPKAATTETATEQAADATAASPSVEQAAPPAPAPPVPPEPERIAIPLPPVPPAAPAPGKVAIPLPAAPPTPGAAGAATTAQPAAAEVPEESKPPRGPLPPGVPPVYDNEFFWFFNGFMRQPWGTLVAILAGWTGLVIALWAAALGLVLGIFLALGAFAATSFVHTLFHAGAGESLTFVGVVTGALAGAGGSFVAVYGHALFGSPGHVLVSLASGAVLAIVIVVVIATFEGDLLRLRGYRRLTRDEVRRISPLLQQIGVEMNLRDTPRFAMADLPVPNAWTHMRHIVLSTALLETLNDAELAAVLEHEMYHWRYAHSVGQHFVWACAWPIAVLYNLGMRLSGYSVEVQAGGRSIGRGIVPFLAWCLLWPSWILTRLLIVPAVAARTRRQEYEADAAAAENNRGPALISALKKLSAFECGRTGWEAALSATHPPTALRIERLQPASADDADYQEPELGVAQPAAIGELAVLAVMAIGVVLIWGAAINASRAPKPATVVPTPSGATTIPPGTAPANNASALHKSAEHAAAAFASAYFGSVFTQSGYQQVIATYAAPGRESAMVAKANAAWGAVARGALNKTVSSNATPIGCRYLGGTAASTLVAVRVDWVYSISGTVYQYWFTPTIPLVLVGTTFRPADVPAAPNYSAPDVNVPSVPAGFQTCP